LGLTSDDLRTIAIEVALFVLNCLVLLLAIGLASSNNALQLTSGAARMDAARS